MNQQAKTITPPEISVNPTDFRLEEFLPYQLSLLSNTISQGVARKYQKNHDISVIEWRVIVVLGRFPGLTASRVVEKTAMDKVSISRAVRSLEEKNFLQRRVDPQDRRRQRLFLTRGKGKRVLEAIVPLAADYETELLSSLTDNELKTLRKLLGKLQNIANEVN